MRSKNKIIPLIYLISSFLLATSEVLFVTQLASAQGRGSCISNSATIFGEAYPYNPGTSADLANKYCSQGGDFSCLEEAYRTYRKAYPHHPGTAANEAAKACKGSALPQQNINPATGIQIYINPGQTQIQSKPAERRTQRQCVNKALNQVWNDIHCQFNNGMFEWRTIYLD